MTVLQDIQQLQFSDKSAAEGMLLDFMRDSLDLKAVKVELRPLAVSLNSFNGFLTLDDGKRLFFKTHTEPDNVIGEYYHAAALAKAGYPVLQPIFSSTEAGKQFLIYEVIEDPSVFDIAWEIEQGSSQLKDELTAAQQSSDDALFEIYTATREAQSAEEAARSPVHQLFYHRLVGGRLVRFYGSLPGENENYPVIALPDGSASMQEVRQAHWQINGQQYQQTLDDLITAAIDLLQPAQEGVSIVGHGDAHNGNVFFRRDTGSLLYFDPAFAGKHHPLLDLTKPLFHNVFAMWMYFPQQKRDITAISLTKRGSTWHVEHNYHLPDVRLMFLESKVERVLLPTLQLLRQQGLLRQDWRQMLKSALFCCPFLTMNLADGEKFPPQISLLGLAMAVEMGAESEGKRSLIDQTLDTVETRLGQI